MNQLPLLFDEPLDRRSASTRASAAADGGRAEGGAQPWQPRQGLDELVDAFVRGEREAGRA